ncbi:MAG: hypothetical protein BM564_07560 [Bacteroidetes bacterium MedPE-SWsnd-G2]|nr:MAG: hypothetical protein BM564_07560 [Bacteroidetes bacterium MedPE-SWsnd-G2]
MLFDKFKNTNGRYFIYYLFFVFIIELIGGYTVFIDRNREFLGLRDCLLNTPFLNNFWWYNITWKIVAVILLSRFYQKVLENESFKRILKVSTILFTIFAFFYVGFNWDIYLNKSLIVLKLTGSIIVLQCVVFYFLELLNSEKNIACFSSLEFYVSAVILIWWLTTMPLDFYNVYFDANDKSYIKLRYGILFIANLLMYLCFSLSLIYSKPQNK